MCQAQTFEAPVAPTPPNGPVMLPGVLLMKTLITLLGLCALLLAGCGKQDTAAAPPDSASTLSVLAGSELKDIEPLLPALTQATGITLQMRYVGTLEAVEKLQAGEAVDAAWLASNRYAMLVPAAKARIAASERTMLTPVVLGIKDSKATELGWKNNPNITWKDIAQAAAQGLSLIHISEPTRPY